MGRPCCARAAARRTTGSTPKAGSIPYVRMLVFTDPASGREHWLLNFACHPTAAGGDEAPYISGDFPGNAMARIECHPAARDLQLPDRLLWQHQSRQIHRLRQ